MSSAPRNDHGVKMNKNTVAIVGTYRKGGIIDQAVDAALEVAGANGGRVEKAYLLDKHIEFCANCRTCTSDNQGKRRGRCVLNDDMEELLLKIDAADALVFGSPINFGGVTAIMKRFVERLIPYTYWPWDKSFPTNRIKKREKKAVLITSSSCPALVGRFLMPDALRMLKDSAEIAGAKVVKSLYFGMVCRDQHQRLDEKQLKFARLAGGALA